MTNEEIANAFSQFSPTAIASGLLNLQSRVANVKLEPPQDDDDRRKAIGARIKMIRQVLGLNQANVAEKLNVSPALITAYETGRREPSIKVLIQLARLLNVTTDWLLDVPPPKPFEPITYSA